MAKTSSMEKNKRRRQLVDAVRGQAQAPQGDRQRLSQPTEERFAARLKLAEMPRNSRQDAHSQPLRDDRSAARLLPQAEDVPQPAA